MTAPNQPAKVLSLGTIVGGLTIDSKIWLAEIRGISSDIIEARRSYESKINVNIEFHVPGDLLQPNFEGVRTGAFNKSASLIKVQVALPQTPPPEIRSFLFSCIYSSLDAVDQWSLRKKMGTDTGVQRSLLSRLD